jgi:Na+-transporting NADH:ubiquinone oxidoreductase subunit C
MSRTAFTDTLYYPVLFMLAISLVFVGVLAAMYRGSERKIEAYKREQYERLILSLVADSLAAKSGTSADEIIASYPQSYARYIKASGSGQPRSSFRVEADGQQLALVYDIGGKGLWGSMRALVAVTPDLGTIISLAIYDQMETPGLGARITEAWFLGQFRGKRIIENGQTLKYELIPEGQQPDNEAQVRQVTGATITSISVLNMLRDELSLIYQQRQRGDS